MILALPNVLISILNQLSETILCLSSEEYSRKLDAYGGSTVGMHCRHIVEFVDCVLNPSDESCVCYDHRSRDEALESSPHMLAKKIEGLHTILQNIDEAELSRPLRLVGTYGFRQEEDYRVSTSLRREIIYNIEHAIHHMAMIKIGLRLSFPHVVVSDDFGKAHSTVRYENLSSVK